MLAYLFWHRPADGQPPESYERALLAFHRRLREVAVPGLLASGAARVSGLPWVPGDGYEDWYAVEDYSALGILGDAAVDAHHADAHERVAHAAGFGAGGLYALEQRDLAASPSYCVWLTKPAGVGYPQFREELAGYTGPGVTVWRRQMVLGPAPEFRLTADRELSLPPALTPVSCQLANLVI
jgi:hypothetical protein